MPPGLGHATSSGCIFFVEFGTILTRPSSRMFELSPLGLLGGLELQDVLIAVEQPYIEVSRLTSATRLKPHLDSIVSC